MKIKLDSIFSFSYLKGLNFTDFSHYTHELIYYLSGEGTTTINGMTYTYAPHTICLTKIGDRRDNISSKKTDYLCIRFLSDTKELPLLSGIYSCPSTQLLELFNKIQKEVIAKDYNYFDLCNLTITEIIYKLSRLCLLNIKDKDFYSLIREIDSTLLFNRSIHEMANDLNYSYDHFRHKFKELTGQPPTSYIINKRIENACLLLQENIHSCTAISQMCGFSSSPQFSKLFKKSTGITPLDYKNHYHL